MILDLGKFIEQGQPVWRELEGLLRRLEDEPRLRLDLAELKRLHYLYERTSADLVKIGTFSAEPRTRDYLESLVGRAYGLIHENRRLRWSPGALRRGLVRFPQTVRRHMRALILAVVVMLAGVAFGAVAVLIDAEAKAVLMPYAHLQLRPSERVAQEEEDQQRLEGHKASFSAQLMTHNTRVSLLAMATGMTYGSVTLILDFYNGAILGAVCADYIRDGQAVFLTGWLLPHGSVEIPAILLACQAGFVLAGALLGHSDRSERLAQRLRRVRGDLVTLILGVAGLLVWAGLVEAFFSQYHEPVLPYSLKIAVGLIQVTGLVLYLTLAGRRSAVTGNVTEAA